MLTMKSALATTLVLATIMAGCVGNSEAKSASGPAFAPVHDADTGSIAGTVVDDSISPIANALVSLLSPDGAGVYMNARTDEGGKYAFNFIPAGAYRVEVKASGFQVGSMNVQVLAGEVRTASFTLLTGYANVAYYVTDHLSRMIGGGTVKYGFECSRTPWQPVTGSTQASLIGKYCVGGNTCPAATGCSDVSSGCQGSYSKDTKTPNEYGGTGYNGGYRDLLMNESDWKTQLAELQWQQSSAISGRGVLYEILGPNVTNSDGTHNSRCGGINQSDPRDFLVLSDKPPIRLEINRDLMAARNIEPQDQCCDFRWRLFPGWCDLGNCARWGPDANALGAIAPTRVEVYYTIFFKEAAPPGWSILQDS
jgi:hypothetical protein